MIKLLLILALLLPAGYVYLNSPAEEGDSLPLAAMDALSEEEIEAMQEEWEPLQVTGDAIAWEVFATTKEHESCTMGEEGYDICLVKPEYSAEVKALDGKEVTLMGYMFPLEQAEKQGNFLIGPYPASCPFHYHVGPTQMVEVFAQEAIAFSYDPVTLKGLLELRFDEETGMFFYLNQARIL